jgi:GNAT superfamily N-acetyltransferase
MDIVENSCRVIVRTLVPTDLARLVAMDREFTGRTRKAWFEGKLKRALAEADLKISLGAEVDGALVGALLGSLAYGEFGQPEPVAILDTVLVDRALAKQGIGKAMLAQLVKNLSALGIDSIRTEVGWREHDLLGFMERNGFTPVPRLVLELDVKRAASALDREESETARI